MNQLLSSILIPETIDDIIGQKHLVGSNCIIQKMIEKKVIYSLIFFGLPGIGKTSLAFVICKQLKLKHFYFNPTKNTKQDLENILNKISNTKKIVIIIDEIHRMNKDKQDILLPYLEKNNLIIIATTTENPYFVVNPAIRSRCFILEFKPISIQEMEEALHKICSKFNMPLTSEQINKIVLASGADLRSSINIIDLIYKIYETNTITNENLEKLLPHTKVIGSSYGNEFYNLLSAFHKSLRGSDCDAAIYYLAQLIKIGDLNSIARRILAMAYEDVGLANPNLISRTKNAIDVAERLGFPEAHQVLATIVIELCLSPKSNSAYLAISAALKDSRASDIPNHLKDNHYKSHKKLGYGDYKYPHDFPHHWVQQEYLPKSLKGTKYYHPSKNDIETKMNQYWERIKNEK
ncbi:replication-associated recombination protein A [Metamycoplasma sualvi]|uniref:replication-associated recombination protein A n=1 Tax=Metamycoplasma sualvi TaxID=2125 RepID=UPI0038731DB1